MDIFKIAERSMTMNDDVWLRHASDWSVWTRIITPMPLLLLAGFSRQWIGWWALAVFAGVALWIWINPRLFAAPKSLDSWAAQGVLGERVFLRARGEIAPHHLRAAYVLTALSALGLVPFVWGLVQLNFWLAAFGALLISGAKTWFVDRMVWIWQDYHRAGHGLGDLTTR